MATAATAMALRRAGMTAATAAMRGRWSGGVSTATMALRWPGMTAATATM